MPSVAPEYVRRVLDYWTVHGVERLPGISAEELVRIENALGAGVPEQLRLFYQNTNGTDVPGSMLTDQNGYKFLRLQDCQRWATMPWLLVFCDCFTGMGYYAIDLGDGDGYGKGTVYLVERDAFIVAKTFDEFTKLYVGADERLAPLTAYRYHRSVLGES